MKYSKTPKLIVIGADGLEPSCIAEFMPTLKSKMDISFDLFSTLPPDSLLAWTIAYTGLGLDTLLKRTPFRLEEYKVEELNLERLLAERIIRKAYWDRLSRSNYKVCVLFPYPIRRTYDLNGVLLTATAKDEIFVSAPKGEEYICDSIPETLDKREERMIHAPMLGKDLIRKFNSKINKFRIKTKILFKLLGEANYDLVYFYTDILESQHFFWNNWRYIEYVYSIVEKLLLNLIRKYGDEYLIMIHGDHGFTCREKYLLNFAKVASDIFPKGRLNMVQLLANFGLRFLVPEAMYMLHLEDFAYGLYPKVKRMFHVKFTSDYLEVTDAAFKSGSDIIYDPTFELRGFCGFYVKNKRGLKKIFMALKPYIKRLYDGTHDSRLKAITVPTSNAVFELKENYATLYNEYAPSVTMNPRGRSLPGTHGLKTALCIHSGPYRVEALTHQKALMIDIAPTVLNTFGIKMSMLAGRPLTKLHY